MIKKLSSLGFKTVNTEGTYTLKIQPEFLDLKTGTFKISRDFDRLRVEINGINNIQEYCKNGNVQKLAERNLSNAISIQKKTDVFEKDEPVQSADFNDFNFRVTYKMEEKVNLHGKLGREVLSNWDKIKKQFRYINRVTFSHPDLPFLVDLSIVRSSTKDSKGQLIKTYNIIDSNVFNNQESYEIEIEVNNFEAKNKYILGVSSPFAPTEVALHLPPVFRKNLFPKGFPVADAFPLPVIRTSVYAIKPSTLFPNCFKVPLSDIPISNGVLIFL